MLLVTSNPTRTSPVKRGQFILENLLGTPAPPPPAVVPPLEESKKDFKDREPTGRELLALHRAQPLCTSCHARMDPLGLALENFNAMGLWRDKERGQSIDSTGKLISGESFNDVRELKRILKDGHKLDFYRCMTEKLLTYALGRGLDYNDVDTVDQIVERLDREGGRFSALLLGVIESAPFQKRRSVSAVGPGIERDSTTQSSRHGQSHETRPFANRIGRQPARGESSRAHFCGAQALRWPSLLSSRCSLPGAAAAGKRARHAGNDADRRPLANGFCLRSQRRAPGLLVAQERRERLRAEQDACSRWKRSSNISRSWAALTRSTRRPAPTGRATMPGPAARFLTGVRVKKTAGADIHAGISVDQVAAQRMGHLTRFPSLELTCDAVRKSGSCDSGYSCAYQFNLSWSGPTLPVAPEPNPRLVFERLFGAGCSGERRKNLALRREQQRSILDFVLDDTRSLEQRARRHAIIRSSTNTWPASAKSSGGIQQAERFKDVAEPRRRDARPAFPARFPTTSSSCST